MAHLKLTNGGTTRKLEMVSRVSKCIYTTTLVGKKAMSRQPSTGSSACGLVYGSMITVCYIILYRLDAMIEALSFGPGKSIGGETAGWTAIWPLKTEVIRPCVTLPCLFYAIRC